MQPTETSLRHLLKLYAGLLAAFVWTMTGCGSGGSSKTPPAIVVTVLPATANVQAGIGTQSFTATLTNDSQNMGVSWSLSGTGCSGITCGTLSNITSTSVIYAAPANAPSPSAVTLTATSVADKSMGATATVTVTAAPAPPTAAVSASPTTIASGSTSTLTWSSTNATSCTASGGWSGAEAASGTQSVSPTSTTTYTLTCAGAGGTTAPVSATVTVAPAPTAALSASPTTIASGSTSTLTWSSTNATSCTASGGWTGAEVTSGTQSVSPTSTTTDTLTCTGAGGTTAPVSATVTVAPAPTAALSASPATIASGSTSILTWSSTNATSCTASGAWSGAEATSGTQSVSPTSTTIYTLTCTGAGGTTSPASATVTVTNGGAFSIKVSGNTFVDGSGSVIQLRGVNLSGMEFVAIQGYDPQDPTGVQWGEPSNPTWPAINAWKANIVRIPLNEASWLALTCTDTDGVVHAADPGANYQSTVARLVQEANASGLYVILDLHWAAPGNACPMRQSQMADADHSIDFWTSVADTYKDNPAVLFELFNEPFMNFDFSASAGTDASWSYLMFGTGGNQFTGYPATSTKGTYKNVMSPWNIASYQAMIDAIRTTGATNVVLIGSDGYTSDLSGWLTHVPTDSAGQMAATWHAYPTYGETWENPCTGGDTYCAPGYAPQVFTYVQGILKAGYPVLTTETGDHDATGTVGSPLVVNVTAFADAPGKASASTEPNVTWPAVSGGLPQIGVLGWTWDTWGGPDDLLIQDNSGTPTDGFGQFFQSWMVNHQ